MAVRFILGRSGTGKTSYCIDAIVDNLLTDAEQRLIFLVPEQATYQAERAILTHAGIRGYHRLHVLSFNRLQFLLFGKNTATPALSPVARQMVIHRICRQRKDELALLRGSAVTAGVARRLAGTIAELHQYAKTPEDIDALIGHLGDDERNSLTALKFADIRLIFGDYLRFIEGKFFDPDNLLTRACKEVAQAPLLKGAMLWVDGFAGFTEAELALLTELLKTAADSAVALCLDPSQIDPSEADPAKLDPTDMFYPTRLTYCSLVERIRRCRLSLDEPVILDEPIRFASSRALAHIERSIFKDRADVAAAGGQVRIVSAPNARAEALFVARQVCRLVRQKNYRYRDIAVIASDIDCYQHYIEACFRDYGIPFFIDRQRPLNRHPVVELVCCALRLVTAGFSGGDIFAYLKTDLVPVGRGEADMLENYCLAFGIGQAEWQSEDPWRFAGPEDGFDEDHIDSLRRSIAEPLLRLGERVCPADDRNKLLTGEEFTCGVFDFLDELGVKQTISRWVEQAVESHDHAKADEHRQFYSRFVDLFDELCEVFAGEAMTADDYLGILNCVFSQMTLAMIPPTLDQVLVGSIERSRHPDLKAVFLIGATQKQFPVPIASGSILTDDDREIAGCSNFQLAPSTSQSLAERCYLAYIAFTRPSEFLCVTYPAADEKGSAVQRSQFIGDLEGLFGDVREESIAGASIDIDEIFAAGELADLLCMQLGKDAFAPGRTDSAMLGELLDGICADHDLESIGSGVVRALSYDNRAQLDSDVARELFGSRLETSATKLSSYAACPYQHFARHVLGLEKRRQFELEPLKLGLFYHSVLDRLTKAVIADGKDFAAMGDDELLAMLRQQIDVFCSSDPFVSSFARRSRHNTYIIDSAAEVLEDCVLSIAQMIRAGQLRPAFSEVAFGRAKDAAYNLGRLELEIGDGRVVALDGKIDRLDVATVNDEKLAVIFDYKRTRRSAGFNWAEFYHGLEIQLAVYLLAAGRTENSPAKNAVGAFYMPVEANAKSTAFEDIEEAGQEFTRKARGIFDGRFFRLLDSTDSNRYYNFFVTKDGEPYGYAATSGALRAEQFQKLLEATERRVLELSRGILSGGIEVTPYRLNDNSPCRWCDYRALCRFDWQINDYNILPKFDKGQVLSLLEGVDA